MSEKIAERIAKAEAELAALRVFAALPDLVAACDRVVDTFDDFAAGRPNGHLDEHEVALRDVCRAALVKAGVRDE